MATTISTTKGQIVIPLKIRKALGLKPGSLIDIEQDGEAAIIRPYVNKKHTRHADGYGMLKYNGPSVDLMSVDVAALLSEQKK